MGVVDRPLFLALVFGGCTSDWSLALPLGIITELCWLDRHEMGGRVPPQAGLAFLLAFPLCRHFGLTTPAQAVVPLLFALLIACVAAGDEERQRRIARPVPPDVVALRRDGELSLARLALRAGLQRALRHACLYAVAFGSMVLCLVLVPKEALARLSGVRGLSWFMLYALALMGPILSLRTQRAHALLWGTLALCALVTLLVA